MSQKIKIFLILTALLLLSVVGHATMSALAASCSPGTANCTCTDQGCDNGLAAKTPVDCPSGKLDPNDTSKCLPLGNDCSDTTGTAAENCIKETPLIKDLNYIVDFLAAAVGIVVVAVIIIGGIQYSLAGGNSNSTQEARKRIMNGLIALVAFIFAFAFLQWLIPGGI